MVYPHKPGRAQWLNSWDSDFTGHTPDCLHTSTLFPERALRVTGRRPSRRNAVALGSCWLGSFDANCSGAGVGGLGPGVVLGAFEAVVGHLAFDDAGLAAQASAWQEAFQQVVLEQDECSDQQVRGKSCPA